MIPRLLFGFLVVAPLLRQDEVERWIDRLESPDSGEREQAEKELVAIGEAALPALQKAMKNGTLEARERATTAYHIVLWNASPPPKDLPEQVTKSLRWPRAQAWTDAEDSPLYELREALQEPIDRSPVASPRLPWIGEETGPWRFLDARPFVDAFALRAGSKDDRRRYWRAKVDGRILYATAPVLDEMPRFLLISGPFDLTQARWNEKTRRIPALEGLSTQGGWESLRLEKREEIQSNERVVAVLFTFGWDQEKPRANLRYVFLADRFAILCVAYR